MLFTLPAALNLMIGRNPIAVTRDGSRFFYPKAVQQPEDTSLIHVKMGWAQQTP